jgi:imidazolonepropionase-like amidohydrolase
VGTHGHPGFQLGLTYRRENYTRDTYLADLDRAAYYGVRVVMTQGIDPGDLAFDIRRDQQRGVVGGARILLAGRGIGAPNAGPGAAAFQGIAYDVTTPEEGRTAVRELAGRGVDVVKIWVDDRGGRVKKLTPELYRPMIEEAHAHGLMALAHVYYLRDAHDLVDAGIDGFMHLVRNEVMDDELIARMKARDVFIAANIGGSRRAALTELPSASLALLAETVSPPAVETYVTSLKKKDPKAVAAAKATYDKMARSLDRLNTAGVTIVLGGDTGIPGAWHGWAEQYELETMVAAGMTPAQVIVASTSVPARILKLDDLGNVAPGKSADFIVLDANPLDDIANAARISDVYLRGQRLDRAGGFGGPVTQCLVRELPPVHTARQADIRKE